MTPKETAAPRRAHTKTRSGCVQCKRRKVKCPEDACPCRNCIRRGLECSYSSREPARATPGDSSYASHSPQSQQQPARNEERNEEERAHTGLSRQDELCLVHHYVTTAVFGITRDGSEFDVWKQMPFHDGARYEFVLDAVLAIAALHKAHVYPTESEKYTSASIYYQSRSMREYQAHLSSIDDENCSAMFAVSALIHVITIAMSRGGPHLLPTPALETLFTSFKLLKGIQVVLQSNWFTVKDAHYQTILSLPTVSPDLAVSTEVSHVMQELRRCAAEAVRSPDSGTIDLYRKTIDSLEEQFRQVEHSDNGAGNIVAWPILIGDEPAELLQRQDPLMMLVFVHYGVLYLQVHETWWAHDYGRRVILDLSESLHALDAAWMPSTSWARAQAAKFRNVPISSV